MKGKAFVALLTAVVVLGGVIGGAFAGGMAIGKGQGREEANQELQGRLSQLTPGFGQRGIPQATQEETSQEGAQQETPQPGSSLPGGFGGLMGRGGTVGTVEKVEGNIITVNTPQGSVSVLVADDTPIQKMGEGTIADISPGENITVSGEQKEDGSIQATNIFITPSLRIQ